MMYLWVKSLHIIAVICWMAGIFYLPRLFVYHSMAEDEISKERFKIMERKLYRGIMEPSSIAAIIFGVWLWLGYGFAGGWLHAKIALVVLLLAYHFWCGYTVKKFARGEVKQGHVFFRFINEVPIFLLIGIVILVVVKPF
ncbi:MAG: protoporphyrinogen oxidase HemJ [Acidiferrobacterales bacterium]|nr:protoporphyrinogen oxidase HemJ [Acidiferrobacterales bacterium]